VAKRIRSVEVVGPSERIRVAGSRKTGSPVDPLRRVLGGIGAAILGYLILRLLVQDENEAIKGS